LKANLGGLVLTAKTDEVFAVARIRQGRGQGRRFDDRRCQGQVALQFSQLRIEREGAGAGQTENLVNLFCSVLEASERRHGQGGGSDSYWQRTLKQLLRNAIDLAVIALDEVSLPFLYRIITSAPRTPPRRRRMPNGRKFRLFRVDRSRREEGRAEA
jgi:hypothetical protein